VEAPSNTVNALYKNRDNLSPLLSFKPLMPLFRNDRHDLLSPQACQRRFGLAGQPVWQVCARIWISVEGRAHVGHHDQTWLGARLTGSWGPEFEWSSQEGFLIYCAYFGDHCWSRASIWYSCGSATQAISHPGLWSRRQGMQCTESLQTSMVAQLPRIAVYIWKKSIRYIECRFVVFRERCNITETRFALHKNKETSIAIAMAVCCSW